jgi:hypothetical protein
MLEVCHFEENPELEKGLFLEEEKSLIGAIAESISRIVEREWRKQKYENAGIKLSNSSKQLNEFYMPCLSR